MSDIDIDVVKDRPLRIGIATGAQVLWDNGVAAYRVRGTDLTDIGRKAALLREQHPDAEIVTDIDVVIASEARLAREKLSGARGEERDDQTMLYVGTPSGLAGLIYDIHTLGITDGAVLIPRADGVGELINTVVLPILHAMMLTQAVEITARAG